MFDAIVLRPRLFGSFLAAALLAVLIPLDLPLWTRLLLGWCAGVVLFITLVTTSFTKVSQQSIRERASLLDDSAPVILVIALLATTASFGAIAALLLAPPAGTPAKATDIALAAATMVLSWTFLQVIFAIHYTHIFYGDQDGDKRGGLQFGGDDDAPDYWDFLYFTVSVGATAQTSDTLVTSKTMRRIVLAQAVYSFFFNTAVLAMAINIAAGLVGH